MTHPLPASVTTDLSTQPVDSGWTWTNSEEEKEELKDTDKLGDGRWEKEQMEEEKESITIHIQRDTHKNSRSLMVSGSMHMSK